jgi:sialate O-acetylesterase
MNKKSVSLLLLCALPVLADVTPSPLFSDHAVLQSGMSVPVWGKADPGEKVTVSIQGQTASATADAAGKWMVRLANLKAGGPLEMTIAAKNSITVKDVLVGEVWLGSGQSNMEFTVSAKVARFAGLLNEDQEIAAANYPKIRMFTEKQSKKYEPQTDLTGEWKICSPETVPAFSAVGYLFARDLQRELGGEPVGILTVALGASAAEAWISREALNADPKLKPMVEKLDSLETFYKEHPGATVGQAPTPPLTINARAGNPTAPLRDPAQDQHEATVIYNGMVNAVIPYAIKGALWYQGESITGGVAGELMYGHVMETLVKDWRKRWGQGDFPFYAVQLPPQANVSNNPMVREQQAEILSLPKTGLAITLDIGEEHNVHPHNKAPLGERLTKIALANVYGKKIEFYGPIYQSMKVQGDSIRVTFTHANGLMAKGGPLKWFQIAGEDQKFVDAEAKIEGNAVVVHAAGVSAPVAVRYGWDNYPAGANLYNSDELPAAPFRTDKWDVMTKISQEFTAK